MFSALLAFALDLAYVAALSILSPFIVWRSYTTGRYRQGWRAKLLGRTDFVRSDESIVIWMHAVSVGEVNLLSTAIERLERELPGCTCVISTTTDTGYQVAQQKYGPRPVFFCPLDFSWAVGNAMRRVQPDLFVLAELELWPNLIAAAKRKGAAVAVINARLSERSARGYGRIRWLMQRLFRNIDLILAQSQEYADRFLKLGARINQVKVCGSAKFDGAVVNRANEATQSLTRWAGYREDDVVWLVGSTQSPEEQLAIEAYLRLAPRYPKLRLALAPRHPERREEVIQLLELANLEWVSRSESSSHDGAIEQRVLLIDVVGELGAWWGRADVAYVGGSMGTRGGQNMIEPAGYGCPVSFGPHTRNFRDVVEMLKASDAATVVEDGETLEAFVAGCLSDPARAAAMGRRARQLVIEQQGAADRTCVQLLRVLDVDAPKRDAAAA